MAEEACGAIGEFTASTQIFASTPARFLGGIAARAGGQVSLRRVVVLPLLAGRANLGAFARARRMDLSAGQQ